jgi:NitT/TauT family transport system substrate-binding protein
MSGTNFAIFAITLAASAAVVESPAAQEAVKIAVGGQRGVGETFAPEIGEAAGIFKKHGLRLEVLYTDSSGETMQAVISRSATIGVATGFAGTMGSFSKGAPVRIIGATFTGGSQLYWYVPAASAIRSVKDTEGKTVAYSSNGSSVHAAVMALRKQTGVNFKPTPTGSSPVTLTAVLSGQVDVGWAGAPFGVDRLDNNQIRLVWKANAVPELDTETIRVLIANSDDLMEKPDLYPRFMAAYEETLAWVYETPDGLKAYAGWSGLPEASAKRALDEFLPRAALNPRRIVGVDQVIDDAVTFKYTAARLTQKQVDELIQIPKPMP